MQKVLGSRPKVCELGAADCVGITKGYPIPSLPFGVLSHIVGLGEFMKADLRRSPFAEFARTFRFFLPVLAVAAFFFLSGSAPTRVWGIGQKIQAKRGTGKLESVRTNRTEREFSQGTFRA